MKEVKKCFNGENCTYEKKECALSDYFHNFKKSEEIVKKVKKEYREALKEFYKSMLEDFKKEMLECLNAGSKIKIGQKNINIFSESFRSLVKKIFPKLSIKPEKGEAEPNLIRDDLRKYFPRGKKVDFVLGDKPRIIIEIKTAFDKDKLGAAIFEAMIIDIGKSDKFIILSLWSGVKPEMHSNNKKMCEWQEIKKHIYNYVCFNPHYEGIFEDIEGLLDEIREIDLLNRKESFNI